MFERSHSKDGCRSLWRFYTSIFDCSALSEVVAYEFEETIPFVSSASGSFEPVSHDNMAQNANKHFLISAGAQIVSCAAHA